MADAKPKAQAWFGGQVVKTLLGSIWPSVYSKSLFTGQPQDLTSTDMKNIMPESTGMTSSDFLCFWIFLIISFPLVWIPPEHYRKPFLATSVISTICCFSLFIWSLARAHGAGPLVNGDETTLVGVAPVKGSALAWAFFYGISSQIGGICAGVSSLVSLSRSNISDLRLMADFEHVGLHSVRSQARRPNSLPGHMCPRHDNSHLPDRHRLHVGRGPILS